MSKILIVDDDATITELMKALVQMEGHEPIAVNNSLIALETAKSTKPDLITLDLMMPGLTGFALCKSLREDPDFAKTPILIITARDDESSKKQAFELGATKYMTKPFGVEDFIATVNSTAGSPISG